MLPEGSREPILPVLPPPVDEAATQGAPIGTPVSLPVAGKGPAEPQGGGSAGPGQPAGPVSSGEGLVDAAAAAGNAAPLRPGQAYSGPLAEGKRPATVDFPSPRASAPTSRPAGRLDKFDGVDDGVRPAGYATGLRRDLPARADHAADHADRLADFQSGRLESEQAGSEGDDRREAGAQAGDQARDQAVDAADAELRRYFGQLRRIDWIGRID